MTEMPRDATDKITRRWMHWFLEQPQERKDELIAYWGETANLPGLQREHRHAGYARRRALIERSRALGYEG